MGEKIQVVQGQLDEVTIKSFTLPRGCELVRATIRKATEGLGAWIRGQN